MYAVRPGRFLVHSDPDMRSSHSLYVGCLQSQVVNGKCRDKKIRHSKILYTEKNRKSVIGAIAA